MKMLRLALVAFFLASPATAQWQTQNHSVPIGKGNAITGFGAAVPGTAGIPLVSNGPTGADPSFSPVLNAGIQPGSTDTYKGSLNGSAEVDVAVPSCTGANQALRYVSGSGPTCGTVQATTGFDMPVNTGLSASASANALTINLTTATGGTPSGASPVSALFRSTVATTGTAVPASVTAALSLTIPSGATLGTSSAGVPFRIWIFLAYNGGIPELVVATCSNKTTVFGCASWEHTLKTTTVLNASSTAAGTPYAPTAVTLDAIRIIGFCDFSSGLTTAGAWASACTGLQLFGPGIKKPGDSVQTVYSTATTGIITPGSTPNLVKVVATVVANLGNGGAIANGVVSRSGGIGAGTVSTTIAYGIGVSGSASAFLPFTIPLLDAPGSVSALTYTITTGGSVQDQSYVLDEIMGALEPANDNNELLTATG